MYNNLSSHHSFEYSIHISKQINIPPCRNPENGMWRNGKRKWTLNALLVWIFVSFLKTANKPRGEMKICAVSKYIKWFKKWPFCSGVSYDWCSDDDPCVWCSDGPSPVLPALIIYWCVCVCEAACVSSPCRSPRRCPRFWRACSCPCRWSGSCWWRNAAAPPWRPGWSTEADGAGRNTSERSGGCRTAEEETETTC